MKLLFVCSGNAHRSPLAEALLKKMRPDLEVDSAGTKRALLISNSPRFQHDSSVEFFGNF